MFREFRCSLAEPEQTTKRSGEDTKAQVDAVEDAFEKYQLWAGNLGAFHPPGDTRSLDYRFRGAPHVRRRTVELLDELLDLLQNRKSRRSLYCLLIMLHHGIIRIISAKKTLTVAKR